MRSSAILNALVAGIPFVSARAFDKSERLLPLQYRMGSYNNTASILDSAKSAKPIINLNATSTLPVNVQVDTSVLSTVASSSGAASTVAERLLTSTLSAFDVVVTSAPTVVEVHSAEGPVTVIETVYVPVPAVCGSGSVISPAIASAASFPNDDETPLTIVETLDISAIPSTRKPTAVSVAFHTQSASVASVSAAKLGAQQPQASFPTAAGIAPVVPASKNVASMTTTLTLTRFTTRTALLTRIGGGGDATATPAAPVAALSSSSSVSHVVPTPVDPTSSVQHQKQTTHAPFPTIAPFRNVTGELSSVSKAVVSADRASTSSSSSIYSSPTPSAIVGAAVAEAAATGSPLSSGTSLNLGSFDGKATFFQDSLATGMCSFSTYELPAGLTGVALSSTNWDPTYCGACVEVKGPDGNKITAMVIDQCPTCDADHIDLFANGFAQLANPSKGVIAASYSFVSCGIGATPLQLVTKDGASPSWFSMQVVNHNVPVRSLEFSTDGGATWTQSTRTAYNFFENHSGTGGASKVDVRLTSIDGAVIRVANVDVSSHAITVADGNF